MMVRFNWPSDLFLSILILNCMLFLFHNFFLAKCMIRGSNFAQFSKCSDWDENNVIASISFSLFRWYIYFRKWSPYGGDIAIWPPSQTGKKFGCWLYLSVQSVRPRGGPYHIADVASWWRGIFSFDGGWPMECWHVSLYQWSLDWLYLCKRYWESTGFDPGTSPHCKVLTHMR